MGINRQHNTPDDSPFWGPGGKAGFLHSRAHGAEADTMPIRKLRARAIAVAIEEMQTVTEDEWSERFIRETANRRRDATVWLGSKEAGRWIAAMDSIRAEHRRILAAIEWSKYAKVVLKSGVKINERQRLLLKTGIEALG